MNHPIKIRNARPAQARPSEDGFTLLAVVFLMTILVVWMAVAAPKMAKSIQRDREVETMHRGKQYIRAIQLYYRKFHAFPPNQDALVKTNEIRFLRKRYIDPMTGKDDWKPIMYGQNKAPIVMGFFGQPVMGTTLGGIGPGGMQGSQGQFGNQGQNGTLGSIFNSQQSGTTPTSTPNAGQSGTDTSNGTGDSSASGTGPGSTTGSGTGSTGTGATDANGNPISGTTGTGGLASGQSFGGAGICGFEPASPKTSILVFKKKTHYNEWEFTYDPMMETMMMMGGAGGAGLNGTNNTNGLGTGTGSQNNQGPGGPGTGGPGSGQNWSPNGNLPGVGQPNNNNN